MASFTKFENIGAWQKSRLLCQNIHQIMSTSDLIKDYKLKDQINGSSGSIMDNIAEGFGRGGNAEFIQFLEISHQLVRLNPSYTECWIENISTKKYLQNYIIWLRK